MIYETNNNVGKGQIEAKAQEICEETVTVGDSENGFLTNFLIHDLTAWSLLLYTSASGGNCPEGGA